MASLVIVSALTVATEPAQAGKPEVRTIPGGTLLGSDGTPLTVGFNNWGYNYQARLFEGGYCESYRNAAWCQPYADVDLAMKWNDAWLSNVSRDGDAQLDRHYGFPGYIGSGAWLTNHQSGVNPDGTRWTYFVKIVAVPADAQKVAGIWYASDGTEIGASIWGEFAIIQEIYNDPAAGAHGVAYLSPRNAGFGSFGPH